MPASTLPPLRREFRLPATALLLGGLAALPAHAVPAFARQTGAECAACHVGAFGPQLTPFGMQFKIGGYTDSNGSDALPLSGMLLANRTHTARDASEAPDHFGTNDNSALQEASVFLAGRLAERIGAFVQSTYSGVDRAWALDQFDVRYARPVSLGGRDATLGLSINGNPTLTDPLNTIGQWRFPYTESDFGFGQGPTPLVENLAGGVVGANAYLQWGPHWYGEMGLYGSLSPRVIGMFNGEDAGRLPHPGTYLRLAWMDDRKRDHLALGMSAFLASLAPDRASAAVDHYDDVGIDASYQWLGNRVHVATLGASLMHERQRLDASVASGAAGVRGQSLTTWRLGGSYTYRQTWGLSAQWFDSRGTADALRWGPGSLNGRPDTAGYVLQADWTPWGKEGAWGAPWANLRVGLQYTGYRRYAGGSSYVDDGGGTRRARDNDTTMLFLWTSF